MGFKISGTVSGGNKIGRMLGFPTANITVGADLEVKDGVYAARVTCKGVVYDAMANVGYKPSVGGDGKRVLEVNMFGFAGDIYGEEISVELLDFIRPEEHFSSFDALRESITADKAKIESILKK